MRAAAIAIFALSYLLISAPRFPLLPIGRAAGALLGAALMVAAGVLTPRESFAAVDASTILLLFAMMLLTAYQERAGFFEVVARGLFTLCRTPWRLLAATSTLAAILSAFLVNDAVCVFLTPVIVAACRRAALPMAPFLLAVATSANLGSAATLVGNPQNMIIGSLSGLPFRGFLVHAGPAALAGLLVNLGLLWVYYGRRLPAAFPPLEAAPAQKARGLLEVSVVTALIVIGFFAGMHLGYAALGGVLLLMIWERREPQQVLARVDWSLLVFFCGLFVVVAGLAKTGLMERAWTAAAPHLDLSRASGAALFSALMTVGSNLVSNVPLVLLTGPHLGELGGGQRAWVLLAYTTTVAGNLTLIGSVANLIVAERAKADYTLGFWEYLRFGAVSTLLTLAAGVPLVYLR